LLQLLREKGWHDVLVHIFLDEGGIDEALAALQSARSPLMGYGYGLYGSESLAMKAARAAASSRPEAALEIYRQQVERLIGARNRPYYAEAARLMVEMQSIHEHLDEGEAWMEYVEDLRQRYRSLRALKDEMARAGL
jgi:hypothetical protein